MTWRELLAVKRMQRVIARQEEYLRGLRELQESQERLLSMAKPLGYRSRLEGFVIKIMAAEEHLANLRGVMDEVKRRLREKITSETQGLLREVLIVRYVECLTWTAAAEQLQVPRTIIYRLHKKFFREGLAENVKV